MGALKVIAVIVVIALVYVFITDRATFDEYKNKTVDAGKNLLNSTKDLTNSTSTTLTKATTTTQHPTTTTTTSTTTTTEGDRIYLGKVGCTHRIQCNDEISSCDLVCECSENGECYKLI